MKKAPVSRLGLYMVVGEEDSTRLGFQTPSRMRFP